MTLFEKALINDISTFKDQEYNVNMQDEEGKSLLHYAIIGSAYEVVDILINKGANVNIKDNNGETPIFDCARKAKIELAKKLINHYAKLNNSNKKGEFPIHLAAAKGNKMLIQLLYENKVNLTVLTNDSLNPIHYAVLAGQIDIIKYILNISNQSFHLLDKNNNTLLHYAAKTTNDLLILYLISEGLNPNLLNLSRETALFNAVRYGTKETIYALLNHNAYINIKNKYRESPIDLCNIYFKYDLETVLYNYQMMPKYERLIKRQSLSLAVLNKDLTALKRHINNNETMRLDKYNYSALDYAKLYKFNEAITILKNIPLV